MAQAAAVRCTVQPVAVGGVISGGGRQAAIDGRQLAGHGLVFALNVKNQPAGEKGQQLVAVHPLTAAVGLDHAHHLIDETLVGGLVVIEGARVDSLLRHQIFFGAEMDGGIFEQRREQRSRALYLVLVRLGEQGRGPVDHVHQTAVLFIHHRDAGGQTLIPGNQRHGEENEKGIERLLYPMGITCGTRVAPGGTLRLTEGP